MTLATSYIYTPMPRSSSNQERSKFAQWIIEQRAARGWSQDDVADRTDSAMTQGYVSSLERDVRKPSREMVRIVARAFYGDGPSENYARFEAQAMEAAGFAPSTPSAPEPSIPGLPDYDEWPDELKRALAYSGTLSPEARLYVYKLWMNQAEAHAKIAEELNRLRGEVDVLKNIKDMG